LPTGCFQHPTGSPIVIWAVPANLARPGVARVATKMLTERQKEAPPDRSRHRPGGAKRSYRQIWGVTGTAAQSRARHRRALFNIAQMTITHALPAYTTLWAGTETSPAGFHSAGRRLVPLRRGFDGLPDQLSWLLSSRYRGVRVPFGRAALDGKLPVVLRSGWAFNRQERPFGSPRQ
jgi:hypothetical protein